LIRFLSEIPEIDGRVLDRVRKVADDPERVSMATTSLQYMIMYRPPVREACVDALELLWRENEDAKGAAGKILGRWRPAVLEEGKVESGGDVKAEGT
jgi:symplekin